MKHKKKKIDIKSEHTQKSKSRNKMDGYEV